MSNDLVKPKLSSESDGSGDDIKSDGLGLGVDDMQLEGLGLGVDDMPLL